MIVTIVLVAVALILSVYFYIRAAGEDFEEYLRRLRGWDR